MDCQQLIVYGIVALIGIYFLRETCGIKLPFLDSGVEGMANVLDTSNVVASENINEGNNELPLPTANIRRNAPTCYANETLSPKDLLPSEENTQIQQFNNANPQGEGILKGLNFLDAGWHNGINTVGQSLRNANLSIREEPANPQVPVSPWMNSTISPDLERNPIFNQDICEGNTTNNNNNNNNNNVPNGNSNENGAEY